MFGVIYTCIDNDFLDGALKITQKMITNKTPSSPENILLHLVEFLQSIAFAVQGYSGNDGMTVHCYSDHHSCRVGHSNGTYSCLFASKQAFIFLTFTQYCSKRCSSENYMKTTWKLLLRLMITLQYQLKIRQNRRWNGIQIGSFDMIRQLVIKCNERKMSEDTGK